MRNIALIGDRILCPDGICQHVTKGAYIPMGVISQCKSSKVLVEGRVPAVVGDRGICGGTTTLTTGSSKVMIQGALAHRVGDRNQCTGTTLGPGSSKVQIGG